MIAMTLRLLCLLSWLNVSIARVESASAETAAVRLDLRAIDASEAGSSMAIEVRLVNVGQDAVLVNRRFAVAAQGNPAAELFFVGTPASGVGCRFNVRPAHSADYVLLGPGEFVGRIFDGRAALCFVGDAKIVRLRAVYRDQGRSRPKGPVLTTEIVSNEISILRAKLDPPPK